MKIVIPVLLIIVFLMFISCDSNEPQTALTLNLTIKDVSCTEAWLQKNNISI